MSEQRTPEERDDSGCICKGNWRAIVKECEPLLGKKFRNGLGAEFTFIGVLHGSDDYYYCMWSLKHGIRLLSCVGSIEGHEYTEVANG